MVGKAKATKAPKAAKVAVLKTKTTVTRKSKVAADEVPTVEVEEVGDDELASLKAELGLSDSYSE
jgi:glutamate racemase